jgi:thymidylate synthase (FAD)
MKLIKPSFTIIEQPSGIEGIYKQIELAGRTCYKSEDKITETSAKDFVDRMIKSGHGAMLEHGTVYLHFPIRGKHYRKFIKYCKNPYVKVGNNENTADLGFFATTNFRVIVENNWMDDLQYICEPTEYHEKRVSVKFLTDRGITHEFVRHRAFSFAQESTRQWRH